MVLFIILIHDIRDGIIIIEYLTKNSYFVSSCSYFHLYNLTVNYEIHWTVPLDRTLLFSMYFG
jgi:hypothetical protein